VTQTTPPPVMNDTLPCTLLPPSQLLSPIVSHGNRSMELNWISLAAWAGRSHAYIGILVSMISQSPYTHPHTRPGRLML
jgi:hypothetical protein